MSTRFSAKDAARTALAAALLVGPTPCAGRADDFTSEDTSVLAEAAKECEGCHALAECADAGRFERFGLWGGKVKQPRRRSKTADGTGPGCIADTAEGVGRSSHKAPPRPIPAPMEAGTHGTKNGALSNRWSATRKETNDERTKL